MKKILYYPYINVPRTEWTLRALLYYDSVGSIVPQEYLDSPEQNYEPFMLELVRNELVVPINPTYTLDNLWGSTKSFLEHIENNKAKIVKAQNRFSQSRLIHPDRFRNNNNNNIHADKFDENILYSLEQLGLAQKGVGRWYSVEKKLPIS